MLRSRLSVLSIIVLAIASCSDRPVLGPDPSFSVDGTYSVTGRVTDHTNEGIEGATVSALQAQVVVASATTAGDGSYGMTLAAGTYDFRVAPPPSSGLQTATRTGEPVNTDRVINFILVPADAITLSGRVLGGDATPLANQAVGLAPVGGGFQVNTVTDAAGVYALTVSPGDYNLVVSVPNINSSSVPAPNFYSVFTHPHPITLDADTELDIQLGLHRVTVRVLDPAGNPASGVRVSTNWTSGFFSIADIQLITDMIYYGDDWVTDPILTDADGNATLWLFSNQPWSPFTITAKPEPGTGLAPTSQSGISITGAETIVITLSAPITLSGRVLGGDATPLANQSVGLHPAGGGQQINTTTDAHGHYSLEVAPGVYNLAMSVPNINSSSVPAPNFYAVFTHPDPITLDADTELDIQLGLHRVTVRVLDPAGNPASGVRVSTNWTSGFFSIADIQLITDMIYYGDDWVTDPILTDADGNATLWLFSNQLWSPFTITAKPEPGTGLAPTSQSGISITGAETIVITLSAPITLSGRVLGGDATPLANQSVGLHPAGGGQQINTTTDANGHYSLEVAPGVYNLAMSVPNINSSSVPAPNFYSVFTHPDPITLDADTELDIALGLHRVDIHVQDLAGDPVSGARVSTNWTSGFFSIADIQLITDMIYYGDDWVTDPILTDADGNATLWLFSNQPWSPFTITVKPPPGGTFATFHIPNVHVSGDITQIVVLQFAHAPPVTTIGVTPAADASGEHPDPVTITLSASAAAGFSIAATHYRLDGGAEQLYDGPFQVAGGGSHTIEYWSTDNTGVFELPKTHEFTIRSAIDVTIDIKPGSVDNPVNLKTKGMLPVAILSDASFDAQAIVVSSVTIGNDDGADTGPAQKNNGTLHFGYEDIDGDGDIDLVLHFDMQTLVANGDLTSATTTLVLNGTTTAGIAIRGSDSVRIVP